MRIAITILVFALAAPAGGSQEPVKPVKPPVPADRNDDQKPDPKQDPKPAPKQDPQPTSRPTEPEVTEPKVIETEVVGLEDKTEEELPAGLDPSDIAAMKSARAMLDAEKRLRTMLKKGEIKDIDRILTFEEISSWPYEDGLTGMPEAVKKLDDEKVMMVGFMLPIDEVEGIKEFLLVQSLWSCCYGQPPDINGIVRVVMKGKSRIDYQFDPIKIIGDFKVEAWIEDGYCLDIYQLHADSVEAIK